MTGQPVASVLRDFSAPVILQGNSRSRTGGPDPDGDEDETDQLRKLMPVLALVITIATVFSE